VNAERATSLRSLPSLVQAEQVRLAMEQVKRIPVPHTLLDLCLAWTATKAGLGQLAWWWFAVMTLCQVGRTVLLVRLDRSARLTPDQMLSWLANLLAFLGAIHAVLVMLVFLQPMGTPQYIMTMILVGNAAGAVSPAAGHLRSYLLWAAVFGGTLMAAWLLQRTLEGAAVAMLVLFLFTVLTLYVRDQGAAIAQLVNLTESLRIERDRAERASEAKTRFFAAASHDLRQPLTALSYNAATVQALAEIEGHETLGRVGEGIRRALGESRALLDSLLEVSELDAGVVGAQRGDVDVVALLSDIKDSFAVMASERGLELWVHCETPRLVASSDPQLLKRIVQNLVGNAIKFTEHGSITIVAAIEDFDRRPGVVIRVVDTGSGIPPESQERVFDEFYQVGNAERNRSRGLGLGLAIVRRLASLIGAQVTLQSCPGKGSTFSVQLPMAVGTSAPADQLPTANGHQCRCAGQGRRVLIVDDESTVRDALHTLLTTLGWQVFTASDEEAAVAAWHGGFAPQAVVLDFRLSGGRSGLDALAALRTLGCDAPAWMVTGDTEPSRITAARAAGLPVLYKPVDGLQLAALMNDAVFPIATLENAKPA
jgi:signal transduction histidine kinase/ActR/RegA family two-component response regulator